MIAVELRPRGHGSADSSPIVSLDKTREMSAGDRRGTRDARPREARGVMGKWTRVSLSLIERRLGTSQMEASMQIAAWAQANNNYHGGWGFDILDRFLLLLFI